MSCTASKVGFSRVGPGKEIYMEENSLSVLLIDDHALFRAGLVVLLGKLTEVGDVHEEGEGERAFSFVEQNSDLDLVLLDYTLPDTDGISVLKKIKQLRPEMPVILLSASNESDLIQHALSEHASGFIPKTSSPDVMLSAIRLVLNGGMYIPPEAIASSNSNSTSQSSTKPTFKSVDNIQLTQRQMEVLTEMKHGYSNKEIAKVLNMSPSTVKVHVAAILRELDASSRTQAVFLAKDLGLLDQNG